VVDGSELPGAQEESVCLPSGIDVLDDNLAVVVDTGGKRPRRVRTVDRRELVVAQQIAMPSSGIGVAADDIACGVNPLEPASPIRCAELDCEKARGSLTTPEDGYEKTIMILTHRRKEFFSLF
jgi:hypothetical protein